MGTRDAQPELVMVARALNEHGLEAILIGNMAAALHGAPVSTIDIDLFFRKTPRSMQKLKQVAAALDAMILRPYYPISALFRLRRELDGLQINFLGRIDGGRTYEDVRHRAIIYRIGGQELLVAETHALKRRGLKIQMSTARKRSLALKKESDRALIELIRYRLSLPPEKRLNCLRRKIGLRATCL